MRLNNVPFTLYTQGHLGETSANILLPKQGQEGRPPSMPLPEDPVGILLHNLLHHQCKNWQAERSDRVGQLHLAAVRAVNAVPLLWVTGHQPKRFGLLF